MPRTTQKEILADRQDESQPPLFDDNQLPVCLPVLESVKRRSYEHQGARLLENDQLALRLVECLMARWGVKKISREMNISPHTVRAARRALVLQGKLAPYKQRVVEMMEDAIEAGIGNYRDALEEGRISAAQIPVGLGIIFDKRQLAMGEPTSISQPTGSQDNDLSVEKLNEYLEQLPQAQTDSQSSGNGQKPLQMEGTTGLDAGLDATTVKPGPRPAGDGGGDPGQRSEGAGGGATAPGGATGD